MIRVEPIRYEQDDIFEIDKQAKGLLELKIIQESKSPHSSLTFMARNHVEIKGGKARMIFNYK